MHAHTHAWVYSVYQNLKKVKSFRMYAKCILCYFVTFRMGKRFMVPGTRRICVRCLNSSLVTGPTVSVTVSGDNSKSKGDNYDY